MKTSDFDYHLPEDLIAQEPAPERSGSRLMALDKGSRTIEHRKFSDIGEFLQSGDLLVFNNTRVIPARLYGEKEGTGAKVEILLISQVSENSWEAMVRPGRKIRPGHILSFGEGQLKCRVIDRKEGGTRILAFSGNDFYDRLRRFGETPLPPYIRQPIKEIERYQTIFASRNGSSAAPTAALHFDDMIFDDLEKRGVEKVFITLHIGPGTFQPVRVEDIENHSMHSEYFQTDMESLEKIRQAKREGRRVIPVGTTSMRTIETVFDSEHNITRTSGLTDIFIYPGYKFKMADALITNFHLPRSTLLMLVSAFAGREFMLSAYAEAVSRKYRFFSFGDSMIIFGGNR